jgi:hypothetical protein
MRGLLPAVHPAKPLLTPTASAYSTAATERGPSLTYFAVGLISLASRFYPAPPQARILKRIYSFQWSFSH